MITMSFNSDTDKASIHDFKIQKLNSEEIIDFSEFKGKKILVVNVASKCGYTPQYDKLEQLYAKFKDELVVVGFPCDQFGGQELDTEEAIEEFCTKEFEVSFPMTTIIDVKGKNQHPIYEFLTSANLNGKNDYKVTWNFNKFLLDEEGHLIEYYPSKAEPNNPKIMQYLK